MGRPRDTGRRDAGVLFDESRRFRNGIKRAPQFEHPKIEGAEMLISQRRPRPACDLRLPPPEKHATSRVREATMHGPSVGRMRENQAHELNEGGEDKSSRTSHRSLPMKGHERARVIGEALAEVGRVEVADLAARLGVSKMTVRRDLEELERLQRCRRVHGGAVLTVSGSYEPPFSVRRERELDEKRAIAAEVARLIIDGETVFLDIGTTTLEVARALVGRSNLTVLTPSVPIVALLADEPGLRIICMGGVVRPGEHSLVGSLTGLSIRQFHADVCVLGIGGIDARAGLTEFNLDDAAVKRDLIERSDHVIVAADHSKLGTIAFATVADLDDIDILVTGATASDSHLIDLQTAGVDIRTV